MNGYGAALVNLIAIRLLIPAGAIFFAGFILGAWLF